MLRPSVWGEHWPDLVLDWLAFLAMLPLEAAQGRHALIRLLAMIVAVPWSLLWLLPFVVIVPFCLLAEVFIDLGKKD